MGSRLPSPSLQALCTTGASARRPSSLRVGLATGSSVRACQAKGDGRQAGRGTVQADCPSAIIWDYLRLLIRSHLGHRSISAARRKTRYRLQPNRSQRALTPPARAHTNYSLPPGPAAPKPCAHVRPPPAVPHGRPSTAATVRAAAARRCCNRSQTIIPPVARRGPPATRPGASSPQHSSTPSRCRSTNPVSYLCFAEPNPPTTSQHVRAQGRDQER